MKAVKMLRIARVFRVFRFCKELSLLALMILDSMKSLMWALLMLTIILYVFAICFTQNATDFIKSGAHMQPAPLELSEVYRQFGSLHRTVYSLLQAMLGGISWGVASDALFAIHWTSAVLFFFYIFFTMLAVLNIITGVFVDNAVETAKTQRDFLVQKEMELKERYLAEMKELFIEMDEDGSGTVSLAEVQEYFADPRVQSYFAALGLDPADTERLFNLLDCNEDGECDVEEFLDGCLRLKGVARSIDVQQLLVEFKKFHKQVEQLDKGIREASLVNRLGSQHSLLSSHAGSPTV
uniref:EF-hand domain-containing protein n=1 Tax=Pyrodinium bahamense TaxID=73915 RepID=A0A7S0AXZ7_9DINO